MTNTEILTALAADATASIPSGHTGAGDPLRRRTKVVNGHIVEALAIGWNDRPVIFEVDRSTEPLTLEAAVARIEVAA